MTTTKKPRSKKAVKPPLVVVELPPIVKEIPETLAPTAPPDQLYTEDGDPRNYIKSMAIGITILIVAAFVLFMWLSR